MYKAANSFEGFSRVPYYMKFSRHVNFANLAIQKKKSRNLSDANNKCREHNMTRKSSDSHYVHYVHRVFYHWNVYKITFFTFLRNCQCKWVLWSIDSRTIIHVQAWNVLWTLRLLCCYWWHLFLLLRFSQFWRYCTFDKVILFTSKTY